MKITIDKLKKIDAYSDFLEFFRITFGRSAELNEVLDVLLKQGDLAWIRWLARKVLSRRENVQLAVWCSEEILPLFEAEFPSDKQPREAIETVKKWLDGEANMEDLVMAKEVDKWRPTYLIEGCKSYEVMMTCYSTVDAAVNIANIKDNNCVLERTEAAAYWATAVVSDNKAEFYKKYAKKTLEIINQKKW